MTDIDTSADPDVPGYTDEQPKCPHGRLLWECWEVCACGHRCREHEHEVGVCGGDFAATFGQVAMDLNLQANMCPCQKFTKQDA